VPLSNCPYEQERQAELEQVEQLTKFVLHGTQVILSLVSWLLGQLLKQVLL